MVVDGFFEELCTRVFIGMKSSVEEVELEIHRLFRIYLLLS